jgi:galactose mutarotase-like enzyme
VISITNQQLSVQIKPRGAELCSLRNAEGTEYLWQADPSVWGRHAPVLFPIVGKLRNNRYALNEKQYMLSQHGFARDMDFELMEQTDSSAGFQLLPTADTRSVYPFEFDLKIIYRLNNSTLEIEYTVGNNGSCAMPFSIGAHPGFLLPGPIENCFLDFETTETLNARLLSPGGLLSETTVPVLNESNRLPLSGHLFDRDALIFPECQSEHITLGSAKHPRHLTVEFPGFPNLGIWSKPGAPFVCIEPWFGFADSEQPYGELPKKPGIQNLPVGQTFSCIHRISIG